MYLAAERLEIFGLLHLIRFVVVDPTDRGECLNRFARAHFLTRGIKEQMIAASQARALEAEPDLSNARLARALFVTPETMHGTLSNLERAGLVERGPDPDHGRAQRGVLSDLGKDTLSEAHQRVGEVEDRMMNGLGETGARRLTASLMDCVERLN